MITVIAEHSVDLSLLEKEANILDLGCSGFLFSDHMHYEGYKVYAVDAAHLIDGKCEEYEYFILAITDYDGQADLYKSRDPQATRINKVLDNDFKTPSYKIKCMSLKSFSDMVGVKFWDLIKMDIEGSEYEVIMSLTEPPATQLSVEFHLHTKIYGDAQVKEMEDKLVSLGYYPAKHDKTQAHGMGYNYWDSLFILQE